MAGIWPSLLPHSTHFTPKSIIRRRAVHNMLPFYMLHSLCSIPSTLGYNLQESLQVQLHLTTKEGEEHLIQVLFFFKYLIFCLSHSEKIIISHREHLIPQSELYSEKLDLWFFPDTSHCMYLTGFKPHNRSVKLAAVQKK